MTKSKREVENLKTQHKINNPVEWGQAEGFSKYLISTDGQVYSLKRDKLIEPSNKNGIKGSYLVVTIYNDKGQKKYMLVHRLVYMAHVGPIPKGMQINHKDENKENNCIENLELMTQKENCNYGTRNQRISQTKRLYSAVAC
jgi:hypothetical protein